MAIGKPSPTGTLPLTGLGLIQNTSLGLTMDLEVLGILVMIW